MVAGLDVYRIRMSRLPYSEIGDLLRNVGYFDAGLFYLSPLFLNLKDLRIQWEILRKLLTFHKERFMMCEEVNGLGLPIIDMNSFYN